MQDTLSLGDNLRLLNGLSYRYDQANSETFYGGRVSSQIWRLFSQLEWHAGEHWLLQGGGMLEDVEGSGSSFSPRLAVNYLFNPQHSLRAVYSEAVRSPGMYENDVDWRYRVRHLTPAPYGQSEAYYFASAHGPGDLGKEHTVRARSATTVFRETGLAVDVRLFHEEITGLISDPLSVVDFSPDNGDRIRFSGAEGQLDWRLGLRDRLRATYAYLDYDATSRYDRRLTARHGGSAGWMRDWGQGWSSALFYYGDDSLNGHRFERFDLRLAKRIPWQGRPGIGRRAPTASRRPTADFSRQPLRQPPPALLQRRGDVLDASLAPRPSGFPGAARARRLLSRACRRGRATGPGQRQPGAAVNAFRDALSQRRPQDQVELRTPAALAEGWSSPTTPACSCSAPRPWPGACASTGATDPGAAAQPGRWPAPAARRQRAWRTRRRRALRTLERPAGGRQLRLARLILPGIQRIGVLYGKDSEFLLDELRREARSQGLELFVASSSGNDDPRPLQFLLGNSDLLLGIDDKQLYNSQSIKSLLLGSYAKNRALLGPTAAFVKAGSLASSYSDQEDWLDTLDDLLGQAPRHWPLSLYPGHFKVLGNRQVARSLGIDLASDADLGRRLAEGEEP